MRKSSSYDEMAVRKQFDRICKLALKGEKIDYRRHIAYRQKHEVMLSELSEKDMGRLLLWMTMEWKINGSRYLAMI